MATIQSSLFSLPCLHTTPNKPHKPTSILSQPNFFQPPKFPRLGVSYSKRKVISCLVEDDSKGFLDETSFGSTESSNSGATINLQHPRRSLLAHFTCNACGVRSQRLINRLAYEKGTVYVQCAGCSTYHQLVDNLNLVVEYKFQDEVDMSPDTDQV